MLQTHAMLRQRITHIGDDQPTESPNQPYGDEASAIAAGEKKWPTLCENVYTMEPRRIFQAVTLTVIDRQYQVCWEREAPLHLARDPSLKDNDAWVLHVLRKYGPLTTPRIEAVAGLTPAVVLSCLNKLEAQGRIRKRDDLQVVRLGPGPQPFIWDIAEGES